MSNPSFSEKDPAERPLVGAEYPFSKGKIYNIYQGLSEVTVSGYATNLPAREALQMPINSTATLDVSVNDTEYPVQVIRANNQRTITDAIGFWPSDLSIRNHFYLLAFMYSADGYQFAQHNNEFAQTVNSDPGTVIAFDLLTRNNKKLFPPFNAGEFLQWAMQLFNQYDPKYITSVWQPTSTNHKQFFDAVQSGTQHLNAIKSIWSAQQYQKLSFYPVDLFATKDASKLRPSPYGHPQVSVQTLYKKR